MKFLIGFLFMALSFSVGAACKQSDLKGTWYATVNSINKSQNIPFDMLTCKIEVNSNGYISRRSKCIGNYYRALGWDNIGGTKVKVSSSCYVSGRVDPTTALRGVRMTKDKLVMSGQIYDTEANWLIGQVIITKR